MGKVKVEQDKVGLVLFGRGDRGVGVLGHGHDAITRVVLDEIFEGHRKLTVIFDDEDIEHATPPDVLNRISPRKIRDLDGCAH